MSTSQAPAPEITNAASTAPTPHKLFLNIPVANVQRAIVFFEALGFAFNPQFTDASSTCMLVGEDAYVMLIEQVRFKEISKRPLGNRAAETSALFALSVNSRAEVDEMLRKAIAAGGSPAVEPLDHGFMYGSSFRDLDAHHWEVFWMDVSAMPAKS